MSSSPEAQPSAPSRSKTHLDLFSGIGGFALAARWSGFRTVGFCEIDPFCQKVLAKNFPGVPIHDDIKTMGGRDVREWVKDAYEGVGNDRAVVAHAEAVQRIALNGHQPDGDTDVAGSTVDLLTGGFPCQPWSVAGKQGGAKDDRHLWPEMARVVAEVRPRWVLGENVAGFIGMGLDDCLFDLESLGYEARAVVVPACAVGAPHRRDRVWIVAHCDGNPEPKVSNGAARERSENGSGGYVPALVPAGIGAGGGALDGGLAEGVRLGGSANSVSPPVLGTDADDAGREQQWGSVAGAEKYPNPEHGRWWESEPRVGRVAHGVPRRVDRLRGLGNAIVPRVAYEIMRHMA